MPPQIAPPDAADPTGPDHVRVEVVASLYRSTARLIAGRRLRARTAEGTDRDIG
ncbi:Asp23/Gls24 family envelope stress response protein OS=Streptomyces cyaneofuscatus OX=66883 GN=G3I52_08100 PE=4 SV=1 [Streptomyces cyaneofuscatus]